MEANLCSCVLHVAGLPDVMLCIMELRIARGYTPDPTQQACAVLPATAGLPVWPCGRGGPVIEVRIPGLGMPAYQCSAPVVYAFAPTSPILQTQVPQLLSCITESAPNLALFIICLPSTWIAHQVQSLCLYMHATSPLTHFSCPHYACISHIFMLF